MYVDHHDKGRCACIFGNYQRTFVRQSFLHNNAIMIIALTNINALFEQGLQAVGYEPCWRKGLDMQLFAHNWNRGFGVGMIVRSKILFLAQ